MSTQTCRYFIKVGYRVSKVMTTFKILTKIISADIFICILIDLLYNKKTLTFFKMLHPKSEIKCRELLNYYFQHR